MRRPAELAATAGVEMEAGEDGAGGAPLALAALSLQRLPPGGRGLLGSSLWPGEVLVLWLAHQCLLFIVAFFVAHALGVHDPTVGGNVGARANVLILYCVVCTFLYREAGLDARLLCSSRLAVVDFHALVWTSALGWSLLQRSFKNVNLSVDSIKDGWSPVAWVLASILAIGIMLLVGVHCWSLRVPRWRVAIPWFCGGLFLALLALASPGHVSLHVHHWQVGMLTTLFFRSRPDGAGPRTSRCAQAVAFGIFVHGVAAFGFGPLFEGIPDCNKIQHGAVERL